MCDAEDSATDDVKVRAVFDVDTTRRKEREGARHR